MSAKRDVVKFMVEVLGSLGASPDILAEAERRTRGEYGGTEQYVQKGREMDARMRKYDDRKKLVADELRRGTAPTEIRSRHGISRAAIYRLLSRKDTES